MLKEHFIEAHGVPLYTVGVGGSGGGSAAVRLRAELSGR